MSLGYGEQWGIEEVERLSKWVRDKSKEAATMEQYDCGTGERANDKKLKRLESGTLDLWYSNLFHIVVLNAKQPWPGKGRNIEGMKH